MSAEAYFDKMNAKRERMIAEVDTKLSVEIRNHLVQLFRKAHAADPGIEGLLCGMGGISIQGTFKARYTDEPETVVDRDCNDYKYCGGVIVEHPEAEEFLEACEEYDSSCLAQTSPVDDITLDDLVSRSVKKAKVWRGR